MLDELCALSEELVQIAHTKARVSDLPAFGLAMRELQDLRVEALDTESAPLVKCFDAIHAQMIQSVRANEEAHIGEHFKKARKVVGSLILALEGQ
jgi:hypothetical protein